MDTDSLPAVGRFSPEWINLFIIIGSMALVVLVVFVWAVAFRKRKNRVRVRRFRHRSDKSFREKVQSQAGEIKESVRERGHRRHRHHRHMNPTLAETGGLPPLRPPPDSPEPPPPAAPPS